MMCALFDTETLMKVHDNNLYREALAQGKAEGMEKGIAQTMISSIKAIMTSLKYTAEQAMELLDVPQQDRARYLAQLQDN